MTARNTVLASLILLLTLTVACESFAGAGESVVQRTAREHYFDIRSLLTGNDGPSWWDDLRGSRLSFRMWVVSADVDWQPPLLRLAPERGAPAEITLQLDDARDWNGAVGDEVVFWGAPKTLRLNPFHLVMDEGIAHPVGRQKAGTTKVPSVTLSIEPHNVAAGEEVTLRWESQNASGAKVNQGIGKVETTGSRVAKPTQTTTYTVTVRGPGGEASASTFVLVQ